MSGPHGSELERGWVSYPLIISKIKMKSESTWIRRICYQRFKSQIFLFQQNPSSDSLFRGSDRSSVFLYAWMSWEFQKYNGWIRGRGYAIDQNDLVVHWVYVKLVPMYIMSSLYGALGGRSNFGHWDYTL